MRQAIILAAALAACTTMPTQRELAEVRESILSDCHGKFDLSYYSSRQETADKCINPAMTEYALSIKYPWMDLVYLANQHRLALSERVDNGEISIAEAKAKQAELGVAITQEEMRRGRAVQESREARARTPTHKFATRCGLRRV